MIYVLVLFLCILLFNTLAPRLFSSTRTLDGHTIKSLIGTIGIIIIFALLMYLKFK